MTHHPPSHVVICGAGVIGAASAYYLSLRGVRCTVVERCEVAAAASGKAGGFLAQDWCDGSPLGLLARKSFALHTELPRQLGVDYGHRRMTTLAIVAGAHPQLQRRELPAALSWLDGECMPHALLGDTQTTAQVHPGRFTRALLQAACDRGAELVIGQVDGVHAPRGQVQGVQVDGELINADAVLIAMGPWSGQAAAWLPVPLIMGLKGHSITLRPEHAVPAQALFVDYVTAAGEHLEPELYPRPDGEVYLCGLSDTTAVPERADLVQPRADAGPILRQVAATLSSSLADLEPLSVQACYRPLYSDGLPLLGRVPGHPGAYLATGHNCWGILNAPASGLAMAELIVDGQARSVDLRPFDPHRAQPGTAHRASQW